MPHWSKCVCPCFHSILGKLCCKQGITNHFNQFQSFERFRIIFLSLLVCSCKNEGNKKEEKRYFDEEKVHWADFNFLALFLMTFWLEVIKCSKRPKMCKIKSYCTAMTGQKVTSGALKVPLQYPRLSISPWLPITLLWASERGGNTNNSG